MTYYDVIIVLTYMLVVFIVGVEVGVIIAPYVH